MKTIIWITSQFEGFHRWKDAPDDVAFLRNYHRHIFEVRVEFLVSHDNRDIEFFQAKRKLEEVLNKTWNGKQFEDSCEMIASKIRKYFLAQAVAVSEDGENGARIALKD
jgi:hypothetical protein